MFWRRRKRLDEEVASHLAEETADNLARGMDPESARTAALRAFGNVEAAKEKARELDPLYWLDTLWQDIRFAGRVMARNRWTSLTIVATLTVGIGLNVSVFTLLNGLLLRPWVRHQPETFFSVLPSFSGEYRLQFSDGGMSQADYVRYRDSAKSIESLAAYRFLELTLSGAESGSIRGGLISCNLFDVTRPGPPLVGRYLAPGECARTSPPAVAVLSESAWRVRFAADPGVAGRVIHLNRVPFTIVGVAPASTLPGVTSEPGVWVPYSLLGTLRPADEYFADPRAHWLTVVGRRGPGYSREQVQQELGLIARSADEQVPGRVTSLAVTDGSLAGDPEMRARVPLLLGVTLGTTTLLLLLACVNVTTLLLSRSAARQREIAVRLSLGAGRLRLLRQLLTESLVLSALAAVFSFLIALRAPAALWYSVMSTPAPFDLSPDWRALLYCLGAALAAGVIAGLSPAVESLRPRLSESLKGSSTAVTPGRRRSRLRSVLVAVQIALSLILLVQAGLFMRAQRRFFSYDPGFETRQVVSVTLASVLGGFDPPVSFYAELRSRVTAVPGVLQTSYASIAPWSGRNSTRLHDIDGAPLPEPRGYLKDPARRMVTPEYFGVLDIPLTRGRAFARDEVSAKGQSLPTVISETMARRYWPGQDPVGRHFRTTVIHEVIGVCRDLQSVRLMQEDGPFYYPLLDALQSKPPYMLIRVSGDPQAAAAAIRGIVRQMDPQMASTVVTLASVVERQGERMKPIMIYGAIGGIFALLLAVTGVYGVVAFSVSQRAHEIGIRVALGAQRRAIVALVLRSGVAPVCGGLIVGLALALAAAAWLESIVFGMTPRDPLTFTIVPLMLFAAALGAIWIPARRAASLDPLTSLRSE